MHSKSAKISTALKLTVKSFFIAGVVLAIIAGLIETYLHYQLEETNLILTSWLYILKEDDPQLSNTLPHFISPTQKNAPFLTESTTQKTNTATDLDEMNKMAVKALAPQLNFEKNSEATQHSKENSIFTTQPSPNNLAELTQTNDNPSPTSSPTLPLIKPTHKARLKKERVTTRLNKAYLYNFKPISSSKQTDLTIQPITLDDSPQIEEIIVTKQPSSIDCTTEATENVLETTTISNHSSTEKIRLRKNRITTRLKKPFSNKNKSRKYISPACNSLDIQTSSSTPAPLPAWVTSASPVIDENEPEPIITEALEANPVEEPEIKKTTTPISNPLKQPFITAKKQHSRRAKPINIKGRLKKNFPHE